MMEMLLALGRGITLTTATERSRRAAEAGVAGRLSRNCSSAEDGSDPIRSARPSVWKQCSV